MQKRCDKEMRASLHGPRAHSSVLVSNVHTYIFIYTYMYMHCCVYVNSLACEVFIFGITRRHGAYTHLFHSDRTRNGIKERIQRTHYTHTHYLVCWHHFFAHTFSFLLMLAYIDINILVGCGFCGEMKKNAPSRTNWVRIYMNRCCGACTRSVLGLLISKGVAKKSSTLRARAQRLL